MIIERDLPELGTRILNRTESESLNKLKDPKKFVITNSNRGWGGGGGWQDLDKKGTKSREALGFVGGIVI